jgi:aminoglycoside phosphotransferase (APT) family kinase protein
MPDDVRARVEARLGASIVHVASQQGGFSPAVAARVRLADGRRAFIKAAGPLPNPDAPDIYRREARIAAALPASTPAPRLLWSLDDGSWVVLAFEDIEGNTPATPWRMRDLERVLAAVEELASALTPSPIEAPPIGESLEDAFIGWRSFAGAPAEAARLDAWARARLDLLVGMEERWQEAAEGDTLLHADLRADNILVTPDRVLFVDWPAACVGASWVDLLGMLPSVAMQGGPEPDAIFDARCESADAADVDAVLAALAGYFLWHAMLPPPPGLPTLRPFQQAQGVHALAWLRRRLAGGG